MGRGDFVDQRKDERGMKGIAAERKGWAGLVLARYSRKRTAPGLAEFTLLHPVRPAASLLQPVFLNFHADLHIRTQHSPRTVMSTRENILKLRETIVRQQSAGAVERREEAPAAADSPRARVVQLNRALPRRGEVEKVVLPGAALDRRTTHLVHDTHRTDHTTAITHVLARREVLRVREAFRRDERQAAQPRIQLRPVGAKAPAVAPLPQPYEAVGASRIPGRAMPAQNPTIDQLPIDAIADRVIGQIDRRLVAHRERMG